MGFFGEGLYFGGFMGRGGRYMGNGEFGKFFGDLQELSYCGINIIWFCF
jgi:hypothetical protein